jgi:hypothetical protein
MPPAASTGARRGKWWRGDGMVLALLLLLSGAAPTVAQPQESDRILSFLRSTKVEGISTTWDFAYASIPPSKQAPRIIVVFPTNGGWCGSGGCWIFILSERNGHYHKMQTIGVFAEPITFVGRADDGFPVLGAEVKDLLPGCCGILYQVALKPRAGVYPDSVSPKDLISRHSPHGRMLISEAKVVCNFRHVPTGAACDRLLRQTYDLETRAWLASHGRHT